MEKERFEYLDIVKGVSIILVVFCHDVVLPQETILGNLVMSIAWGAVPCFMMVSGGIMHQQSVFNWKSYFFRICKIYCLIIMWKTFYLMFFTKLKPNYTFRNIIEYVFFFSELSNVNTGHLWFMYAYLCLLLFYPISYILFKNNLEGEKIAIFVMILLFINGVFIPSYNLLFSAENIPVNIAVFRNIIPFANYSNMLFYFILGGFLHRYRNIIKKYVNTWISLGIFLTGTIGLMFIKYKTFGNFYWMGVYLEDGYSRFSTVLLALGLYSFFMVTSFSGKTVKILTKYIGKSTMGIFYLHIPLLSIFSKYLYPFLQNYYSFSLNTIKTISTVIICCLITIGLKKIPLLKELVK